MPPAQNVQMQMADRLTSIGAGIDDDAVAVFESLPPCDVGCCRKKLA